MLDMTQEGQNLRQNQLRTIAMYWKSSGNRDTCQTPAHNLKPNQFATMQI